jgi:hypothetical protein
MSDAVPVKIVTDERAASHSADRVRYMHAKTAKGWNYETTVEIHRMPGEDGRTWLARSARALKDAREIAVTERDERNRMDGHV